MRYALITGATSGIGAEYAKKLAEKGYNLIVTGRREEVIKGIAEEINERWGVEVSVIIADFTIKRDVDRVMKEIRGLNIEFLVNNVGFGHKKKFLEDSYENQKKMIDVHIDAMCRITHYVAGRMKTGRRGHIVNVSSMAAFTPAAFNHLYSASKIFINTFSEALYIDLMDKGVKVQALCPGFTRTDFHREMEVSEDTFKNRGLIRWMKAEDVVEISYSEVVDRGGICIPGICNKILYHIVRRVPKKFYYKVAKNMAM